MTTIAFRDGVMAADSRVTFESEEAGVRIGKTVKLFRKEDAVIGLAGESEPGLIFLDWYGSGDEPPGVLIEADADFTALVLNRKGLWEYGKYCRPERVLGRFHAIGTGAKAALGALHMGASARQAVAVAAKIDPYTGGKIMTAALPLRQR